MIRIRWRDLTAATGACVFAFAMMTNAAAVWSPAERQLLQSLPVTRCEVPDPAEQSQASLGQLLFWEKRLSGSGNRSCASCHDPRRGWADGRPLPRGGGLRHTPTLWHVASNAWFFWDGRTDSLAAQALHPIESALELKGDRQSLARLIASDPELRAAYERAFGPMPPLQDAAPSHLSTIDALFANVGRALAAFERQLVSTNSPFDRFAEALARNEPPPAAFSLAAQRGLKLFIGRAACVRCHTGPSFSDGGFHNTGLASPQDEALLGSGSSPLQRESSQAMLALSRHSPDDLERLAAGRRARGEFKTPTLRHIAETAPYTHDGRFRTLREVVTYYSTLEGASFAAFGVTPPIRPLHLSGDEIDDLVAFLQSLTGSLADPRWGVPPRAVGANTHASRFH